MVQIGVKIKTGHIVIALLLLPLMAAVPGWQIPGYLIQKMEKQVLRMCGRQATTTPVTMPDSVETDHLLYAVKNGDSLQGFIMISRALGCSREGCDKPGAGGGFEEFFYMTLFSPQRQIKKVNILEYTGDYGYQIANKGWLKQFENGQNFEVGRNVDGISGATISVKSITAGVNRQLSLINKAVKD